MSRDSKFAQLLLAYQVILNPNNSITYIKPFIINEETRQVTRVGTESRCNPGFNLSNGWNNCRNKENHFVFGGQDSTAQGFCFTRDRQHTFAIASTLARQVSFVEAPEYGRFAKSSATTSRSPSNYFRIIFLDGTFDGFLQAEEPSQSKKSVEDVFYFESITCSSQRPN